MRSGGGGFRVATRWQIRAAKCHPLADEFQVRNPHQNLRFQIWNFKCGADGGPRRDMKKLVSECVIAVQRRRLVEPAKETSTFSFGEKIRRSVPESSSETSSHVQITRTDTSSPACQIENASASIRNLSASADSTSAPTHPSVSRCQESNNGCSSATAKAYEREESARKTALRATIWKKFRFNMHKQTNRIPAGRIEEK